MYVNDDNLLIIFDIITDDDFAICYCNKVNNIKINNSKKIFDIFQKQSFQVK
jgi:hypothetical protein